MYTHIKVGEQQKVQTTIIAQFHFYIKIHIYADEYVDMSVSIWSKSGRICSIVFTNQILSVGKLDQTNGKIFNNYFT